MDNFSQTFKELNANVRRLIHRKTEIEADLEQLIKEKKALVSKVELLEAEIEELREKNKILRIAGSAKGEDNREIKLKINEIVREVDKCIAQLNQ